MSAQLPAPYFIWLFPGTFGWLPEPSTFCCSLWLCANCSDWSLSHIFPHTVSHSSSFAFIFATVSWTLSFPWSLNTFPAPFGCHCFSESYFPFLIPSYLCLHFFVYAHIILWSQELLFISSGSCCPPGSYPASWAFLLFPFYLIPHTSGSYCLVPLFPSPSFYFIQFHNPSVLGVLLFEVLRTEPRASHWTTETSSRKGVKLPRLG